VRKRSFQYLPHACFFSNFCIIEVFAISSRFFSEFVDVTQNVHIALFIVRNFSLIIYTGQRRRISFFLYSNSRRTFFSRDLSRSTKYFVKKNRNNCVISTRIIFRRKRSISSPRFVDEYQWFIETITENSTKKWKYKNSRVSNSSICFVNLTQLNYHWLISRMLKCSCT